MKRKEIRVTVKVVDNSGVRKVELAQLGFEVSRSRGNALVHISLENSESIKLPKEIISDGLIGVFVDLDEEKLKNHASVVCGISGKRLKPYYIQSNFGSLPDANFSVMESAVQVTVYVDGVVEIEKVSATLNRESMEVKASNTILFKGIPSNIPGRLKKYKDAVSAAIGKLNDTNTSLYCIE